METIRLSGLRDKRSLRNLRRMGATIDAVSNGVDLQDYTGLNDADDIERIRNYIARTKEVVDNAPQSVQGYVNPEDYSNMLDYVLRHWDMADREDAIRQMAEREKILMRNGGIRTDGSCDEGGFFQSLQAALVPQDGTMADALNGAMRDFKARVREHLGKTRRRARRVVSVGGAPLEDDFCRRVVMDHTTVEARGLSGLAGEGQSVQVATMLYGHEICGVQGLGGIEPTDETYQHLVNAYNLVTANPQDFFAKRYDAQVFTQGLSAVLLNWNDVHARIAAADHWAGYAQQDQQLSGFLKKAAKKIATGVKNVVKATVVNPTKAIAQTIAKTTKTIAKNPLTLLNPIKMTKMAVKDTVYLTKETVLKPTAALVKYTVVEPTKAIIKVTKKVVKLIIRYNPVTLLVRAIICLAARKNWFNIAKRCYAGSFGTYEEAKAACGDKLEGEDYYAKSQKAYSKLRKVFTAIGGHESEIVKRLAKGYDAPMVGSEDPSAVTKDFVKKGYEGEQTQVDADVVAYETDIKSRSDVAEEVTDKGDDFYEENKEEVEETENIKVTTQAADFFASPNDASPKATIAKGTALLYDTEYKDEMGVFIRVEYNGTYGYIHLSCVGESEATVKQTQRVFSATKGLPFYNSVTDTVPMLEIPTGAYFLLDTSRNSGAWVGAKVTISENGKSEEFEGYIPQSELTDDALAFGLSGISHRRHRRSLNGIGKSEQLGWVDVVVAIASAVSAIIGIVSAIVAAFKSNKPAGQQSATPTMETEDGMTSSAAPNTDNSNQKWLLWGIGGAAIIGALAILGGGRKKKKKQ